MMKKNIAKLLVFAMLLSMLPFAAAAADGQVTPQANDTGAYVIIGDVTVNSQTLSNPTVNDSTYAFTGDVKAVVGTELTIILNAEASDNSQVSVYKVGADSSNLELLTITSVAKDRKAPSGGKSRTREADDAAIFA